MKKSVSVIAISVLVVLAVVLGILFYTNNADKSKQIETLSADVADKSTQIETLNADIAGRDNQIQMLNADVAYRDGQIAVLNEDVKEKAGKIDALNQSVSEKKDQIDALSKEITEKTARIESLNADVQTKTEQIEKLNNEITEKTEQIETLKTNTANKEAAVKKLETEVEEKKTQIESLSADLISKETAIAKLNQDIQANADQIELFQKELAEKNTLNSALNQALEEQKTKLDLLNISLSEKEQIIQNTRTIMEELAITAEKHTRSDSDGWNYGYNSDEPSCYGYVMADAVNFREAPSSSSRRIRLLKKYALALIVGHQEIDGETWYKAEIGGNTGYINGKYFHRLTMGEAISFLKSSNYMEGLINNECIVIDTPISAAESAAVPMNTPLPTPIEVPKETPEPVIPVVEMLNCYGKTNSKVYFRKGAGSYSKKAGQLNKNTYVYMIAIQENEIGESWTYCMVNGRTGYVMSMYLDQLTQEESDLWNQIQNTPAPVFTLEDVYRMEELQTTPSEPGRIKINMDVVPKQLSAPGKVNIVITITNTGDEDMPEAVTLYDPDGVKISEFGDPVLAAGASKTWQGEWWVTEKQFEAGKITFSIKYAAYDGDPDENGKPELKYHKVNFTKRIK